MSVPTWLKHWVTEPTSTQVNSEKREWVSLLGLLAQIAANLRRHARFSGLTLTQALATIYQPLVRDYSIDYTHHGRADSEVLIRQNKDGSVSKQDFLPYLAILYPTTNYNEFSQPLRTFINLNPVQALAKFSEDKDKIARQRFTVDSPVPRMHIDMDARSGVWTVNRGPHTPHALSRRHQQEQILARAGVGEAKEEETGTESDRILNMAAQAATFMDHRPRMEAQEAQSQRRLIGLLGGKPSHSQPSAMELLAMGLLDASGLELNTQDKLFVAQQIVNHCHSQDHDSQCQAELTQALNSRNPELVTKLQGIGFNV